MKKIYLILLIVSLGLVVGYNLPLHSQEGGKAVEEEEETEYPTEPIIFTKPVKAVLFDHKIHVEEAGLSCEDCHEEIFEQEAGTAQENEDFTMKSLYEGKYCGTCHDGETAFASNTRCAVCHIGVMGWKRLTQRSEQPKH